MKYLILLTLTGLISIDIFALNIIEKISPQNRLREKRKNTKYILLHTTEGAFEGSLRRVIEKGSIHFLIDKKGRIYQIIGQDRIAEHAGDSMWNDTIKLNDCSIGIEMVGYHHQDITTRQYIYLRKLLIELKQRYKIPDSCVLTHSMVAYGEPNRWHKKAHRGRKRCGMQFALIHIRKKLGLEAMVSFDPDVKAKRLIIADPLLHKVLYGSLEDQLEAFKLVKRSETKIISKGISAWDIARDKYNSPDTLYIFPNGKKMYGNEITEWRKIPPGTKVKWID